MNDVAVCISGAMRGKYEVFLKNINEYLVEPLSADVFISTWDTLYLWPAVCDRGEKTASMYLGKEIAEKLPSNLHGYNQLKTSFPNTFSKLEKGLISPINADDVKSLLPTLKK